jgi:hypothetical protein
VILANVIGHQLLVAGGVIGDEPIRERLDVGVLASGRGAKALPAAKISAAERTARDRAAKGNPSGARAHTVWGRLPKLFGALTSREGDH